MSLINLRSAGLALSLALVSVSAHAQGTINAGETYINAGTLTNAAGEDTAIGKWCNAGCHR